MQGLGFFSGWLCCMYVREKRGLDSKTILSFVFRKIKPQKKLIFKKHLYQRQINCCFSISCHLLLILSWGKAACWSEEGSRWAGWHWGWRLGMFPRACVMMVWFQTWCIGWASARTSGHQRTVNHKAQPVDVPEESSFCFALKGASQTLFLLVFPNVSLQKVCLCRLIKQISYFTWANTLLLIKKQASN